MWKKSLSIAAITVFMLAGCGSYDEIPSKHETPMEDIRTDLERDLKHQNEAENEWDSNNPNDTTGSNQTYNSDEEMTSDLDENPQIEILDKMNEKNDH